MVCRNCQHLFWQSAWSRDLKQKQLDSWSDCLIINSSLFKQNYFLLLSVFIWLLDEFCTVGRGKRAVWRHYFGLVNKNTAVNWYSTRSASDVCHKNTGAASFAEPGSYRDSTEHLRAELPQSSRTSPLWCLCSLLGYITPGWVSAGE